MYYCIIIVFKQKLRKIIYNITMNKYNNRIIIKKKKLLKHIDDNNDNNNNILKL